VFDTLDKTTSSKNFRGCRYTAAELSLPDPKHPAHAEVRTYKQRLHDPFERELEGLGHPYPAPSTVVNTCKRTPTDLRDDGRVVIGREHRQHVVKLHCGQRAQAHRA
jgi:hypothetical protein